MSWLFEPTWPKFWSFSFSIGPSSEYPGFHDVDEDGEQCALIGLWKACENYDETKGCKLSAYATPFIIKEVSKYYKAENKHKAMSIDAELADTDGGRLLDCLKAKDNTEFSATTKAALDRLKPREKEIAIMKGGGMSDREIAEIYGISKQRVYQIVRIIRKKLEG